MGTLSFRLPAPVTPAVRWCLDRAAVIDVQDLTPIPTRRRVCDDRLILTKDTTDSACVALPWPVADYGHPVVRTGTLREREAPYDLVLELARGKIHQLRHLVTTWGRAGLPTDMDMSSSLSETTRLFGRAAVDPSSSHVDELSELVIAGAHDLGDRVARAHADHTLASRLATGGPIPCHLSIRLAAMPRAGVAARLPESFTAVRLHPDWGRVEPSESVYRWEEFDTLATWAAGTRLAISAGPIIDLERGLPEWLSGWSGDLPSVAAFMCDFAETFVRRYQSLVGTWEVIRGFNHGDLLGLGEDDRLRLAARVLESCRDTAPNAQWVITVTHPFGDYMATDDLTYSPYVFADTLLRAGYRLAGVNLDLRSVAAQDYGWQRDPMEIARLLEHFSSLGVPLETTYGPGVDWRRGGLIAGCREPISRWTGTSMALSASTPHVRAVHWDPTWHTDGGPPDGISSIELTHTPDVPHMFSELRSYLA